EQDRRPAWPGLPTFPSCDRRGQRRLQIAPEKEFFKYRRQRDRRHNDRDARRPASGFAKNLQEVVFTGMLEMDSIPDPLGPEHHTEHQRQNDDGANNSLAHSQPQLPSGYSNSPGPIAPSHSCPKPQLRPPRAPPG